MRLLQKLGITKDSISKLLGIQRTVDVPVTNKRKKLGRPVGHKIDQSVVDAVRKASKTYTIQELADRYNVSNYWVWCIRHNKLRVK